MEETGRKEEPKGKQMKGLHRKEEGVKGKKEEQGERGKGKKGGRMGKWRNPWKCLHELYSLQ